jgi:hypothetical protein
MILSTCRMSRFFQTCWRERNSHSLVLEIIGNAEPLGAKSQGRAQDSAKDKPYHHFLYSFLIGKRRHYQGAQ